MKCKVAEAMKTLNIMTNCTILQGRVVIGVYVWQKVRYAIIDK